jgi:ROK family
VDDDSRQFKIIMKTLCVDIGGTRVKYTIIDSENNRDQLKESIAYSIPTLGWLNHSLPELFNARNKLSIVHQYHDKEGFDRVAIGFPGGISPEGELTDRDDLVNGTPKVPREIRAKIQNHVKKPVLLINDANAWIRGIKYLLQANTSFVAIILGTGIGVGMMQCMNEMPELIDVNQLPWEGSGLEKIVGKGIKQSWEVHGILGRGFFPWVEKHHKDWTSSHIKKEYTIRVAAFLNDILQSSSFIRNFPERVFFGGGSAEWLDSELLNKETGSNIEVLSRTNGLTFNPDLIPLIGLGHSFCSSQTVSHHEQTHPPSHLSTACRLRLPVLPVTNQGLPEKSTDPADHG